MTRVLLTRPRPASERFADQLRHNVPAAQVLISPVVEIEHLPMEVDLSGFDGLVLTSAHALGVLRAPVDMLAFCVGDSTARAARRMGLTAYSAKGDVRDLAQLIGKTARGRLLYLRGEEVSGNLEDHVNLVSQVTYRQKPVALNVAARDWLAAEKRVVVPLFSPRSAARFVEQMEPSMQARRIAVCISAAAAAVCKGAFSDVKTAKAPTANAMVAAVAAETFA